MKWNTPPIIKVYEALGCIADNRIIIQDSTANVYSSSKGKYYTVTYDDSQQAIMCNDNGSYYIGYLGYPAIAFLMKKEILPFNQEYAEALKSIPWKDINQKHQNDFDKTQADIDTLLQQNGIILSEFTEYAKGVLATIESVELRYLGEKTQPPTGY